MSTSLLYHGFAIRGYEYVHSRYEKGQVIFKVKKKRHVWPMAEIGHITPACKSPSIGGVRASTDRDNVQFVNRSSVYLV